MAFRICPDDPGGPSVRTLLRGHLADVALHSPPESIHALDLDGLRAPDIGSWTVRDGDELLACGAPEELDATHGEVKSMRTAAAHLRRGAARAMLDHLIAEARRRGYRRLSLETGTAAAFALAHRSYVSAGFVPCGPFAGYIEDPHSCFMSLVP